MQEKILITSALPYANGPLHFGHIAGAYLPGDCYARFQRLQGHDVLYVCGSDEYGIAITLSAELAKRTPKEQVDFYHQVIFDFFQKLQFSFDHYSRTTWPGHVETVQAFFLDLLHNGYIEEKETEQLFSEKENRFLADRYVQGSCPKCGFDKARGDECQSCGASYEATDLVRPVSKLSGTPLVHRKTKHWFLRFDLFKEQLEQWIDQKAWKSNVVNFAKSYIKDLRPRAITRDSDWGVPVPLPGTEGKVLYVWFDAPIGYISATKEWAKKQSTPDLWKKYWLDEKTKLVQFIGKDNIPFHAVFFPAMIMGQNTPYKLVDELPANEFYNLEGRQFSKSDGWYVDLDAFFTRFSSDQIRYAIASNAPETQDSEFSWKDFQMRCNAELVGKLGNFVNRVSVFAHERCGGVIPSWKALQQQEKDFLEKIHHLAEEAKSAYSAFHLRKACQILMEIAQAGNVYFDMKKPWKSAKDPSLMEDMNHTIRACLECIRILALVAAPIIPSSAEKIWAMLGYKTALTQGSWTDITSSTLTEGSSLEKPEILFKKVEDDVIAEEIAKLHTMASQEKKPSMTPLKSLIGIEDVQKIDLRVAQIESVERVPKSKKLLKLSVDIGSEKRTIVAGIGDKLETIEALIGKKIVVVANLKPAQLMGVESQGMILAAKGCEGLELPVFYTSNPGDSIS